MGNRQVPFGFDQLRQVEAFDVFHREDDVLPEPHRGVGRDDVRVPQLRDGADLAQEAVEHAGALDDQLPDHLEHLVTPHKRVAHEVDHAHSAPPQLLPDLVIRMVGPVLEEGCRPGERGEEITPL